MIYKMWPLVVLSHTYIFVAICMFRQHFSTCGLVQYGLVKNGIVHSNTSRWNWTSV